MTAADRLLRDRVALITGASRGIGLATARALAGAGAATVLVARNIERLQSRAEGLGARPIAADVATQAGVEAVLAALDGDGLEPDILVNNAGVFPLARLVDTSPEMFQEALQVNLGAPFLLARALVPRMQRRGRGDVVTIGSIADRHTYPENAAYAASKFGVRALHEVLRQELRGSGVRCTLVSPGPVDTPLWDAVNPDARPGFTRRAAMLRPDAVAAAVLWTLTLPRDTTVEELRLSRS